MNETQVLWETPDLPAELVSLLDQIPPGRITTYGDLARALGERSAARWVGEYLKHHPHEPGCPCHRVVRHSGDLGEYTTGNPEDKARLLQSEGIAVVNLRADLSRRFDDFTCTPPLAELSALQQSLRSSLWLAPLRNVPELVAGVDASYVSKGRAVAAYALIETGSGRLVWSHTIEQTVMFPYIPGFLSFREIPILLSLVEEARRQNRLAELVFVDGSGILHPRRCGIAAQFGVMASLRTIGVSKKLLCGSVDLRGMAGDESREIVHDGEVLGVAYTREKGAKPLFISPGHRVDIAGALRAVRRVMWNHRLPEPIWHADSLSRAAARAAKCSVPKNPT